MEVAEWKARNAKAARLADLMIKWSISYSDAAHVMNESMWAELARVDLAQRSRRPPRQTVKPPSPETQALTLQELKRYEDRETPQIKCLTD